MVDGRLEHSTQEPHTKYIAVWSWMAASEGGHDVVWSRSANEAYCEH